MSSEHEGLPPDVAEVELSDLPDHGPRRVDGNGGSRRRRMLRRGTVFVALALVAAALIYTSWRAIPSAPPGQATPAPAARFLPPAGLGCVQGGAWDPTSTSIALVGTPDNLCGNGGYTPNVVNIYRARTAALVRQLHPDAAVFAALGMPQTAPVTPVPQSPPQYPQLTYQMLRWSPDGTRLAMSFNMAPGYNPTGAYQSTTGLVLIDPDGSHERVLLDRSGVSQQPAYTVWDLQAGTSTSIASPPPPIAAQAFTPNSLPLALSYTWNGDGSLAPGAPLSVGARPPALVLDLVGNPIGGHSFGMWQPGQLQIIAEPVAGQQEPTYLYLFQSTFAAWSPDGRSFIDQLNMGGLLLPTGEPAPSDAVLSAAQLDQAPRLPIRDASLQQALANDLPLPPSLGIGGLGDILPIAWRPDGKVLAVQNQDNGFTLRAAATGQIVKSVPYIELPPSSQPPPSRAFGTPNTLLWSPDGTRLLLPSLALVDVGRLSV